MATVPTSRTVLLALSALVAECEPLASDPTAQRSDPIVDPGAVAVCRVDADPTGAADATTAFRDALACATMGAHPQVFVPQGSYALSAKLVVPANVAMVGQPTGSIAPTTAVAAPPWDALPTLRFPAGFADDAIELGDRASVTGLQVAFAGPQAAGHAAVRVTGIGTSVQTVRITNAGIGVYASGDVNSGRVYVNNVSVYESTIGLWIDFGLDISRFENVHVERAAAAAGTIGFVFGRNDYMIASKLSAVHTELGLEFRDTSSASGGGSIASLTTFDATGCTDGMYVHGGARVASSGVTVAATTRALHVAETATLSLAGARLSASRGPAVNIASAGASLTITGSVIEVTDATSGEHAVSVAGARLLNVTGNALASGGHGVFFGGAAARGVVAGNTFELSNPSGRPVIGTADTSTVAVTGNSSNR